MTPQEYAAQQEQLRRQREAQLGQPQPQPVATPTPVAVPQQQSPLLPALAGQGVKSVVTDLVGSGGAQAGAEAVGAAPQVISINGAAPTTPSIFAAGGPLATAGAVAGGAYTGYQQGQGVADLAKGKAPGLVQSASLLPFDGGATLANAAAQKMGFGGIMGGKNEGQIARDQVRSGLQKIGALDNKFQMSTAKGGMFNMGLDGGARLQNKDGTDRPMYNADWSNPLTGQTVGWANPLAAIVSGGNEKLTNDFAGYLSNFAQSDAEGIEGIRANMLQAMKSMGLDATTAQASLDKLKETGAITPEKHAAYTYGLGVMLKGDPKLYVTSAPPAATSTPQAATPPVSANPMPGRGPVSNLMGNTANMQNPILMARLGSSMATNIPAATEQTKQSIWNRPLSKMMN